jgi:hypothetical protein
VNTFYDVRVALILVRLQHWRNLIFSVSSTVMVCSQENVRKRPKTLQNSVKHQVRGNAISRASTPQNWPVLYR